jgi:hypothetical protein
MNTEINNEVEFIEVPVNELSGLALDWSVALLLWLLPKIKDGKIFVSANELGKIMPLPSSEGDVIFSPSTSFEQAGHLINHIGIDVRQYKKEAYSIYHYNPNGLMEGDVIKICEKSGKKMIHRPNVLPANNLKWYAKGPESSSMPQWIVKGQFSNATIGDSFIVAAMRWIVFNESGKMTHIPKFLECK